MPCFGIIGGKKFAYVSNDHHGDGKTALLVKISGTEEQAMLIDSDEDRYYRPAYLATAGWVSGSIWATPTGTISVSGLPKAGWPSRRRS